MRQENAPIFDGRTVHEATAESGHLRTKCGLVVTGYWRFVDGREVDCPICPKEAS